MNFIFFLMVLSFTLFHELDKFVLIWFVLPVDLALRIKRKLKWKIEHGRSSLTLQRNSERIVREVCAKIEQCFSRKLTFSDIKSEIYSLEHGRKFHNYKLNNYIFFVIIS